VLARGIAMTDSTERRDRTHPNALICAGGLVLSPDGEAEHGDECLYRECPHPVTCATRRRKLQEEAKCCGT